jgi:pterin-4a-carbinolamine dehydratase
MGRDRGGVQCEFHFKDFSAAINFVNRLAEVAETAGHHPDISIHWNRVVVRWWTQRRRRSPTVTGAGRADRRAR